MRSSPPSKTMYPVTITKEGPFYVARCFSPWVTSQGETLAEARANITEAIELYLESFGAPEGPSIEESYLTSVEA